MDWAHLEPPLQARRQLRAVGRGPHARVPARVPLRPAVRQELQERPGLPGEGLADQRDLLGLLGDAVLRGRHEHGAQLPRLRVGADQRAG